MNAPYRLIRRKSHGGRFYLVESETGKRTSLNTTDRQTAERLLQAKCDAVHQPHLNRHLARAYHMGSDPKAPTRTWGDAISELIAMKRGSNQDRWKRVLKDKALAPLFVMVIADTHAESLLKALNNGCVSTNIYLRRLHNFCLDMGWLLWPLIPKRQWPALRFGEKRAITREEHVRIIEREHNPERKAFYELAWHLGASQSDLAHLKAEDVNWNDRIVCFVRQKIRWRNQQPPQIRFGTEVEAILATLPKKGPLFPYLVNVEPGHRATEFRQRCLGLGIRGVTLHSYRYAWAERARTAGYPERFAQLALGHGSKAVHRAYSRKAQVTLPPLEEFEKAALATVIPISAVATA